MPAGDGSTRHGRRVRKRRRPLAQMRVVIFLVAVASAQRQQNSRSRVTALQSHCKSESSGRSKDAPRVAPALLIGQGMSELTEGTHDRRRSHNQQQKLFLLV